MTEIDCNWGAGTTRTINATGIYRSLTGFTAATSATTGTMTVNMISSIVTITPTGDCTFNATGGSTGRTCQFVITTSGSTSRTLTFGTNFKTTGTLATGVTTAKIFVIDFICTNGTQWVEVSRTTAI